MKPRALRRTLDFLRRHRLVVLSAWGILTLTMVWVVFQYAIISPLYPSCARTDGTREEIRARLNFVYGVELHRIMSPLGSVSHVAGTSVAPQVAWGFGADTDHLWLEAAQATWERLPDKARLRAPEPVTSDLPECDLLKLYALEKSDRTWKQCAWFCDRN